MGNGLRSPISGEPALRLLFSPRRFSLFLIDNALGFISLYAAYLLRFEGQIPPEHWVAFLNLLPFVFVCRSAAYLYFNFYARFWEYSTVDDLIQIMLAVVAGTLLIMFSAFLYDRTLLVSRSIIVIDMMLLIMLIGGTRLGWRLWRERLKRPDTLNANRTQVLILGAGDIGAHLLRYLRQFSHHYHVCGFVDDDSRNARKTLMEVKVLGTRHDIPQLVQELKVKEVLVAAEDLSAESLGEIIDICTRCGVKHRMVASVLDLATREIHISKIKNIEIQDLLSREQIALDLASIKKMVQGKRILITGAGGSIGSELCRQVLEFEPAALIMVDRGENYLYELKGSLNPVTGKTLAHYLFCSVTNQEKIDTVFARHRPHLVFHAAAHKHVPLMEQNPDEAVINNIHGTRLVAEASDKYAVEKFILVSTDKVVRPSSVMGMTKRVAEKYIQHIGRDSETQFMIVRFGNVLGSNGSVVPLFKKQISEGGPVTVTHPDMERFFMLIPEAAQLILQAASIGGRGNIFLLEMGQPVKIVDLAKKMIQLAGYVPDQDIEIEFTGVRPGEKLKEELINPDEKVVPTFHKKIKILKAPVREAPDFIKDLDTLHQVAKNGNPEKIVKMLWTLGNETQPIAQRATGPLAGETDG